MFPAFLFQIFYLHLIIAPLTIERNRKDVIKRPGDGSQRLEPGRFLINNIMKTYTREQLIEAQTKYNQKFIDEPEFFSEHNPDPRIGAENVIDYLLSLVED